MKVSYNMKRMLSCLAYSQHSRLMSDMDVTFQTRGYDLGQKIIWHAVVFGRSKEVNPFIKKEGHQF